MNELKRIQQQIIKLRNTMHDLIDGSNNLIDYEVVAISQTLDVLLNRYHKIKSSIPYID